MRKIIFAFFGTFLLVAALIYFLAFKGAVFMVGKASEIYHAPDTTITITNGKADTLIHKR